MIGKKISIRYGNHLSQPLYHVKVDYINEDGIRGEFKLFSSNKKRQKFGKAIGFFPFRDITELKVLKH